jgi:Amt family ammonium transporter
MENLGQWFVSWLFCSIAITITSGTVAERITFRSYVVSTFIFATMTYPFLVHWAWSSGWASPYRSNIQQELLGRCGVLDFAGSGVVHMTGGLTALIITKMIGPRKNRFTPAGLKYPAYNTVFHCLGTLILWFGWYGYNAVAAHTITGNGDVVMRVVAVTTISAACSCLTTVTLGLVLNDYVSSSLANGGALSGLVAISAGCATTEMEGALVIGVVAGILYYFSSNVLVALEIDDITDSVSIHFVNGAWGLFAAGLFTTREYYKQVYFSRYNNGESRIDQCMGAFYGGNGWQLGANLCFIFAILAWVGSLSLIMYFFLDMTLGVRVDDGVSKDNQGASNTNNNAPRNDTHLKSNALDVLKEEGEQGL